MSGLGIIKYEMSGMISKVLEGLWDKLKLNYNQIMVPTPEHFVKNSLDCYDKFSKIKCLAKNQAIMPIKSIYVPLTLSHTDNNKIQYQVNGYDSSFFESFRQLLIVDTAGMGKSTLVKRLFIDIVDCGCGIPIFIELRRLSRSHCIIDEFMSQVSFTNSTLNKELLYSFIRDGKFIFILDGYDEISLSEKQYVTKSLQDFITHSRSNVFIMTSRQEISLSSFEGFEPFRIKPLEKDESFALLKKYDEQGETSELLISMLKSSCEYDEFLGNPLLASMLLMTFSFKNEVPRQKHVFYRSVFDAYFNSHDLTKGGAFQHEKNCGLGSEEFHRVLRYIGTICLKKGRVEFEKDEFISIIEQALYLCPEIKCSSGDYFLDIIETVPLFIQDGLYYRWAHKSICEYFAAQNIYRDIPNKERVLNGLISDSRIEDCYNLLDLYYEIDYSLFRRSVIKGLFERIVSCVELEGTLSREVIRRRQCFVTNDAFYFVYVPSETESTMMNQRLECAIRILHEKVEQFLPCATDANGELYVFQLSKSNRDTFLLRLLKEKKHPAMVTLGNQVNGTLTGVSPKHLYQISDANNCLLCHGQTGDSIMSLIECFGDYVDYFKAKEELNNIQKEIEAVDTFASDLFS